MVILLFGEVVALSALPQTVTDGQAWAVSQGPEAATYTACNTLKHHTFYGNNY